MNNIIPTPSKLELLEGFFIIDNSTVLYTDFLELNNVQSIIQDYIFLVSDISISSCNTKNNNHISLKEDKKITKEGYEIEINDVGVVISASHESGLLYGFQSLIQIFDVSTNCIKISKGVIVDKPRFGYRGFMLDVSRHFFSVNAIKKLIENLSKIKINHLHLHLTDDQGWRIEIKKYPKLTSVGSRRESIINTNLDEHTNNLEYGGFYSQNDIKEIISHGEKYYVSIVPEIDIPGHCSALLAAYPEFSCTHNRHKVENNWVVKNANLCPNPKTLEFILDVFKEIISIFPSEYIHIGCDEFNDNFNTNSVGQCEFCKKYFGDKLSVGKESIYYDFLNKVIRYLEENNKKVIGWDELLEGNDISNAVIMSWRSIQGSIKAAKQGRYSILSPHENFYLSYPDYTTENNSRSLSLEKILSFNSIIGDFNSEENEYILGLQGCLWTEYITNENDVYKSIFPRILAISELCWSSEGINYKDFLSNIDSFKGTFPNSFFEG